MVAGTLAILAFCILLTLMWMFPFTVQPVKNCIGVSEESLSVGSLRQAQKPMKLLDLPLEFLTVP